MQVMQTVIKVEDSQTEVVPSPSVWIWYQASSHTHLSISVQTKQIVIFSNFYKSNLSYMVLKVDNIYFTVTSEMNIHSKKKSRCLKYRKKFPRN